MLGSMSGIEASSDDISTTDISTTGKASVAETVEFNTPALTWL